MRIHWGTTLVLVLLGCGRGVDPANRDAKGTPPAEDSGSVVAFVAASTKDAVQEIGAAFFEQQKTKVKINADDSSKLALQITQEAPADVFLSANEKWAEFVKGKGLVEETRVLLGNSLVIVVPKGNPAGVEQPEDLAKARVHAVAVAGPTVPAGIYARQALKKLGVWSRLETEKKVISGDNVRVTLTYVERGETDAGVVYSTDARISKKVEVAYTFDQTTHDAIRYPLMLLKPPHPAVSSRGGEGRVRGQGQRHPPARAFYEFLQGAQAKGIFQKHGFTVIDGK